MHGDLDCQISVRDLNEGLCQQVGQKGQAQWDLAGNGHLIPKPRPVGPPGAITMILLHGESCNFSTTLPNMAAGGKAYASRSSHGRPSASTAVARGSGTSDTNRGNLLLNLVANRTIFGLVPPAAYCLEDLWKERQLQLDGLA